MLESKSLKELCYALNKGGYIKASICCLPSFGGEPIKNTNEVYSYDKENVLLQNYNGDFYIDKRCKCGEASLNCICGD